MSLFANIALPPLARELTYVVPDRLAEAVRVGVRVLVPLGSRTATGYITSITAAAPDGINYKEIGKIYSPHRCFSESELNLFRWTANYYQECLANVIDVAIPAESAPEIRRTVRIEPNASIDARGPLQRRIVEELRKAASAVEWSQLTSRYKGAAQCLRRLADRGLILIDEYEELESSSPNAAAPEWAKRSVVLNAEQQHASQEILSSAQARKFDTFLLHGVTGSGKTEIYIEVIKQVLQEGRGALVIVPEIALTPQLIDRFCARLGGTIAVLHSGLAKRTRWSSWRSLIEGRCRVAIGARSAVFAPVADLGIIIVDEEHDSSYKQSDSLRYNARDLAVARGKLAACPVVLGSATPSLESFYNTLKKRYHYLHLQERVGSQSPLKFKIIDLRKIGSKGMTSPNISTPLFEALKDTLNQKGQAFVLYNRRGFASYLQCTVCGDTVKCPNCSVTLTFYRRRNVMLCHYCNLRVPPPLSCVSCASIPKERIEDLTFSDETLDSPGKLIMRGGGTEKVYDELSALFPAARIDRLDRDAASNVAQYREILDRVRSGDTDILVGTQMLAKGHDLPEVTLVGIVDCDVGLHFPDFRAGERAYQLLTQAAGRAGRGDRPGVVVMQTRLPEHASITAASRQSFKAFAGHELQLRKQLSYPPFGRLLRIVALAADAAAPLETLNRVRETAEKTIHRLSLRIVLLGPAPAPIEKIKARYRWHMLVKSPQVTDLMQLLKELRSSFKSSKRCRLVFDLDPQDML